MGLDYYASSPVLVMPPQPPAPFFPQSHLNSSSQYPSQHFHQHQHQSTHQRPMRIPRLPRCKKLVGLVPRHTSLVSAAGRKRGREDEPENQGHDEGLSNTNLSESLLVQNIAGSHGLIASSTQSTNTSSTEVKLDQTRPSETEKPARPDFVSRKSQRLFATADPVDVVARHDPSITIAPNVSSAAHVQDAPIDEASLVLGIGWTKISGDASLEAAARGWARYIQNNFALDAAEILLHNKGNGSYVVKAFVGCAERYCLFTEDLRQYKYLADASGVPADNAQAALHCMLQTPLQLVDPVAELLSPSQEHQQPFSTVCIDVPMDAAIEVGDAMIM